MTQCNGPNYAQFKGPAHPIKSSVFWSGPKFKQKWSKLGLRVGTLLRLPKNVYIVQYEATCVYNSEIFTTHLRAW